MNYTAIFIIAMIALAFLGLFVIPRFMLRRALGRVIATFRRLNATTINSARTIEELGMRPRGMIDGMFRGRDYRPYALDMLRRADVVQTTEDGRLYLSEDRLMVTGIAKRV